MLLPGRALPLALVTVFFASGLIACAGGGGSHKRKKGDDEQAQEDRSSDLEDPDHPGALSTGRGEVMPSVTFGDSAEENWKLGEDAFKDEDYLAAQRYYSYVRTKFPYSQYAALSDLRIGDCQFARSRYIEAIDSYNNFVRLHPTHERVPYAIFRAGVSHYQQIPGDWFLLPPSEEKEQTAVHDAERNLRDYVERFPNDDNIEEGKKLLTEVRKKLLAHERYVANFYRHLGKDRAYVGRLQTIRKSFKDVGLDDALLLEIVTVYARLGQIADAEDALKEMEQKFAGSPKIAEARAAIATAQAEQPKPEPKDAKPEPKDAKPAETKPAEDTKPSAKTKPEAKTSDDVASSGE